MSVVIVSMLALCSDHCCLRLSELLAWLHTLSLVFLYVCSCSAAEIMSGCSVCDLNIAADYREACFRFPSYSPLSEPTLSSPLSFPPISLTLLQHCLFFPSVTYSLPRSSLDSCRDMLRHGNDWLELCVCVCSVCVCVEELVLKPP